MTEPKSLGRITRSFGRWKGVFGMAIRDEIAKQALTLSPEDRAFVADLLEGSLPTGEFSDPAVAAAWSREIDRRVQAYDQGETIGIDFDVALRQMRTALRARVDDRAGL